MKKLYTLIALFSVTFLLAQDLVMTVSVPSGTTSCRLSGPWWGWDPNGGPVGADNGNDTFTFTFSPAPGADMEYLFTINGSGVYENLIDNAQSGECDDRIANGNMITDYSNYANRIWKASDALIWNETYDNGSEANLSIDTKNLVDYKLFPNPTKNLWNITTNNNNIESVVVYDVLGKQVYALEPNKSEVSISSESLSNGIYFAKLRTRNGESNLRLVKH
jgi:hypothetical protein